LFGLLPKLANFSHFASQIHGKFLTKLSLVKLAWQILATNQSSPKFQILFTNKNSNNMCGAMYI
jgi:hypothetical protein